MMKWGIDPSIEAIKSSIQKCRRQSRHLFQNLISKREIPRAAIIIPLVNMPEASIILQKRAAGVRHSGEISFPGGMLGRSEDSLQGTIREFEEEMGWRLSGDGLLGEMGWWHNRKSNILVNPWIFLLQTDTNKAPLSSLSDFTVNKGEVDHLFLATLSNLLDDDRKYYRRLYPHWPPVPHFTPDDTHTIWGFSGFVLDALLQNIPKNK